MNRRRAALIVLDGLGIGAAPDAADWGDAGSDTLGNVTRAVGGVALPNLERLGLGCCADLAGIQRVDAPEAAYGVAIPASPGKDSTTGHWELCGLRLAQAFPTYPGGFPDELVTEFARRTGREVIGNVASSGTAILDRLGAEHMASGAWIVYTSADSVFQVAAHEDVVPLGELYRACTVARELLTGEHGVSRVIARPFTGKPGNWTRTPRRKDFSLAPPGDTLIDRLAAHHIPRVGVGKVDDLFAGRNLSAEHTATNAIAYGMIGTALGAMQRGLLFANVIEFDQSWGHRNDVAGFVRGLRELDAAMPRMLAGLRPEDLVIFTADHGNDPTTPSTDHSREQVPVLVTGPRVRPAALGQRQTFADVGQTIAEFLGVEPLASGISFLREVWID
ncbi:MAG TPA: phosphopentomutase [Gemmatimonadales bacterium]|nr:phosphopentomutase [Gemmatimonadales bacterium]